MRRKVVEKMFEALFAMEDLREVLRRTAPFEKFTEEHKKEMREALRQARKALDDIESELG